MIADVAGNDHDRGCQGFLLLCLSILADLCLLVHVLWLIMQFPVLPPSVIIAEIALFSDSTCQKSAKFFYADPCPAKQKGLSAAQSRAADSLCHYVEFMLYLQASFSLADS